MFYITIETFFVIGRGGSEITAVSEALGKLVSYILRNSSNPEKALKDIANMWKGIAGSAAHGFGKNKVSSLPDAIAKLLGRYNNKSVEVLVDKKSKPTGMDICPSCGAGALKHEGECKECANCGFSAC